MIRAQLAGKEEKLLFGKKEEAIDINEMVTKSK